MEDVSPKGMSGEAMERYKLIFEAQRYASDYRVKLVRGWAVAAAAFAATLGWIWEKSGNWLWLSPVLLLAWAFVTVLFRKADERHRNSLHVINTSGAAIEEHAMVDEKERFFQGLLAYPGVTHSRLIDAFAEGLYAVLTAAALVALVVVIAKRAM